MIIMIASFYKPINIWLEYPLFLIQRISNVFFSVHYPFPPWILLQNTNCEQGSFSRNRVLRTFERPSINHHSLFVKIYLYTNTQNDTIKLYGLSIYLCSSSSNQFLSSEKKYISSQKKMYDLLKHYRQTYIE